jgi:hypothetical protein
MGDYTFKSRFVIICYTMILGAISMIAGGCAKTTPDAEAAKTSGAIATPRDIKATIPNSTQFLVALSDTIQTNRNIVGDIIYGRLARSVDVGDKTLISEGATVKLIITQLVKGGKLKTSPEVAFTIQEITFANGKNYSVETDQISDKGRSHTAREVGMIGGGAAAGAVIGNLIGKGKGAAIGAATGAAAGTGAAALTGRQNLIYLPGEILTFTLRQPITISMNR